MTWNFYALRRESGRFMEPFKAVSDDHAKDMIRDALDGPNVHGIPDPHAIDLYRVGSWDPSDAVPMFVDDITPYKVCNCADLFPSLEETKGV